MIDSNPFSDPDFDHYEFPVPPFSSLNSERLRFYKLSVRELCGTNWSDSDVTPDTSIYHI